MKNRILSALLILTIFTSCATIMHGSRQSIGISSVPTSATVYVDGVYMGQTPIVVQMTRKNNHFLRIELDGFQPYEAVFSKKLSGWVLGNIIFGGFIGLAVDAVTGAIYQLTPDQIQAEMRKNSVVSSKKSKQSYITVVLNADPSWKKIGNLVSAR